MKPYLLIAGYQYYPSSGTGDWIACFETYEEAEAKWEKLKDEKYSLYEWHEIVDLREWIGDTTFDTFGPTGLIGDPQ